MQLPDYAANTVTIEAHPHSATAGAQLSVHPCRHAGVMAQLLRAFATPEDKIAAYLPTLLKFCGSVLPTVELDHAPSLRTAGARAV